MKPIVQEKDYFCNSDMRRPPFIPLLIGTGFGAGFWPWGPGTAGAVLATVIWAVLAAFMPALPLAVLTVVLIVLFTWLGTWATRELMPFWGEDPKRVVVDEMVGVWIPLLIADSWWTALAALLLFRIFDILKPWGIRRLDERHGAFWVMADDLAAGVYSIIVLAFIRAAHHLIVN